MFANAAPVAYIRETLLAALARTTKATLQRVTYRVLNDCAVFVKVAAFVLDLIKGVIVGADDFVTSADLLRCHVFEVACNVVKIDEWHG
jgi:hypothetical protein